MSGWKIEYPKQSVRFGAGSPFHEKRWQVVREVSPQIRTGDIVVRRGNESWAGIPFSKLVARVTESKWSHASIAVNTNGNVDFVEVNDKGTQLVRMIDWLDWCVSGEFAVYRIHDITLPETDRLKNSIDKFILDDPDYDFSFDDPKKFYCTEATEYIFEQAGIQICDPKPMKELVVWHAYAIIVPINWFTRTVAGKGIPLDVPMYVVGNEKIGMLSSRRLSEVLTCKAN